MEEQQRSKRRRVYSVKPHAMACANFSLKYISHLLPALSKLINSMDSSRRNKDNEIRKIIRFEVDMALVLSTGEFRWSRALRHKLEHGMSLRKLHNTATLEPTTISTFNVEMPGQSFPPPAIPRSLVHVETDTTLEPNSKPNESSTLRTMSRPQGVQRKESGREEDIDGRIKTLRLLLPGGNEMGSSELLSEMESYVVCLQLQVNVLRCLVGI